MREIKIDRGWQLIKQKPLDKYLWENLESVFMQAKETGEKVYELKEFPAQVHSVLLSNGVIENPNIQGKNDNLWIHEYDWIYRCTFKAKDGLSSQLILEGVDTFADIWLNGICVGSCADVFMEYIFDITDQVRKNNVLIVYFHSAKSVVERIRLPEKYEGRVPGNSAARVFRSGFHEYCGPIPSLIRCGLYGAVTCIQMEEQEPGFLAVTVDTTLNDDLKTAEVRIAASFTGGFKGKEWQVILTGPDGEETCKQVLTVNDGTEEVTIAVANPRLWWPWTHGESAVYTLEAAFCGLGEARVVKQIGFRTVEQRGELDFYVNGKPVKLWGVNLTHPDTLTNCYDKEKMGRLLDLAQLSNCNILRIWGESEKYPEAFYEECDRRGLLLWHDFYLCCSMYSEEPKFLDDCEQEARQMVERLKNHPCILLWCGGNELYLARDYGFPETYCFGAKIVEEVFPRVCSQIDPERYYHTSSPSGGAWANDPLSGDTHGYTHLWFVPGRKFPVCLSENCRVSAPALKTMERMMTPEELWPAEYGGKVTKTSRLEWPESWNRHTTNECWKKLGPIEHYVDAECTEDLIYRIGAAHAEYIHEQVCRFRRGYSGEDLRKEGMVRKTKGHMLWKFNNNSNIISFGVVDYFLEPYYPYYELKRCYSPLLVSCELEDHGYVWVTNDTAESVTGRMEVFLFHLVQNQVTARFYVDFKIEPDESRPICSLDAFGQFRKENIICARAFDQTSMIIGMSLDACEIERKLIYPTNTGLTIAQEKDGLVITSDAYARCVELVGEENGDRFGWLFSDNYFDLLPGMSKRVEVLGVHRRGTVTAKAFYDDSSAVCEYIGSTER